MAVICKIHLQNGAPENLGNSNQKMKLLNKMAMTQARGLLIWEFGLTAQPRYPPTLDDCKVVFFCRSNLQRSNKKLPLIAAIKGMALWHSNGLL